MTTDTKFKPSEEAPYGSVASIAAFFANARMAKRPSKIDMQFMNDLGIKPSTAWSLFPALRFLGLMGKDGTTTQHYEMVALGGVDFTTALANRVQEAYGDLFEKLDVSTVNRERLEQYFRINFSPKLAYRQTVTFVGLCQMAGISLAEAAVTAGPREKSASKAPRSRGHSSGTVVRKRKEGPDLPAEQKDGGDGNAKQIDLRGQYIAALIKRVETSSPEETKELMDRIEALLGMSEVARADSD